MEYASMVLFCAFFVFAETRFWSRREIVLILNVVIIACAVYAFLMLRQNVGLRNMDGDSRMEFFGTRVNRNAVAFSIVPGSVCATFCLVFGAWKKSIWKTVYYALMAALCLYTVFCTGGRSALYSAAFGDFLIIWEVAGKSTHFANRYERRLFVLIGAAVALLVVMNLTEGRSISHNFNIEDSSGRDHIWEVAWQMVKEKPVFGGGFDYWAESGIDVGTHNNLLTILIYSGWFGGVIFLIFLLSMVLELWSTKNFVLLAFIIEMLFHSYSEASMDYFGYIPLCIAFMLYRYIQQNQSFASLFEKRKEPAKIDRIIPSEQAANYRKV